MPDAQALTPNLFKRNLAQGKKQLGLWLALDSPFATEILAGSGADWLLLDLEHSCIDLGQVVHHLRAAKGGTAEMLVRVPWNDAVLFKRLLDVGVRSFMVPMVQSAQEARAVVAATRYPPQGIRGAAGNTRASDPNRRYPVNATSFKNVFAAPWYFDRAINPFCCAVCAARIETLFTGQI